MKLLKAVLMTCFLVTCLVVKRTLSAEKTTLTIGLIAPYTSFKTRIRAYNRAVLSTVDTFSKSNSGFSFPVLFNFASPEMHLFRQTPNPRTILDAFCKSFLEKKVTVILYMMNSELYGTSTAASQYFLQLASYLGIPVIAWNADNSGLERKMMNSVMVQLAPTIHHQSAAMLRILQRYQWSHFSIVTSEISGNMDFIQAVRDNIYTMKNVFKFTLLSTVRLTSLNYELVKEQLSPLLESETRVILLYSTYDEAKIIFKAAKELELVGRNYMWVVTQSVVGNLQHLSFIDFPLGSLGVHFDTDIENMAVYISMALKVFAHGLDLFTSDISNFNASLQPDLSCSGRLDTRWAQGVNFYRYLKKVNISMGFGKPNIEFNKFGSLKNSELDVINLNDKFKWEKIGSWTNEKLEINDIVWPGNSHIPPAGRPEKFHLKVTFLEELPYVNLEDPDEITGTCVKRGELCRVATDSQLIGVNLTEAKRNASFYKCCSGLCVDLLQKFANDLGFTYDLVRVEDGIWGSVVNGTWNGLIAALINRKADIVMTSLKINSQRSEAIDFSIPFLETGIAVVVAKRTGIVSPMAFLEPFDTMSWLLILIVSIQMAGFAIFMFEWLSPVGYDMKFQPPRDHKFSLFRTYWLVWAMLFGAAVEVDCPRGFTARFMANVWAMFAVVFLAIYTANLAAFMITREEFYDLTGIGDNRLMNPFLENPPFRFGTVSYGNTEAVLKANYPQMYNYMRQFNRSHVSIGIQAVKKGELDAFIYDSTVLEYLVTQDDECRLLTVGTWYAMTGYGVAFPKRSKYLDAFNKQMMIYRENGDLERLQRFWLTGACRLEKQERSTSNPLGIKQFTSAFLLLGCGIVLALLLLATEHCYFSYLRKPLASTDTTGCCALVSLSMGKSLTFREAVFEAQDVIRNHKCADPLCDTHLWKVKHELDIARLRINALERALLLRHSDYDNSYNQPNRKNGCLKEGSRKLTEL